MVQYSTVTISYCHSNHQSHDAINVISIKSWFSSNKCSQFPPKYGAIRPSKSLKLLYNFDQVFGWYTKLSCFQPPNSRCRTCIDFSFDWTQYLWSAPLPPTNSSLALPCEVPAHGACVWAFLYTYYARINNRSPGVGCCTGAPSPYFALGADLSLQNLWSFQTCTMVLLTRVCMLLHPLLQLTIFQVVIVGCRWGWYLGGGHACMFISQFSAFNPVIALER
jgi:hypothetical protein